MKVLTIKEAEKEGLCENCIAYRPEASLHLNGHCFSTNKKAGAGHYTNTKAKKEYAEKQRGEKARKGQ